MLFKTNLVITTSLSNLKSKIKCNDIEFTVVPDITNITNNPYGHGQEYPFYVQDEVGEFEFISISSPRSSINYDHLNKRFVGPQGSYTITISTNVDYKKVECEDPYVIIPHNLFVSAAFMKSLKLYEYVEEDIVFPGYQHLNLKKILKKSKEGYVDIVIKNPDGIEIGNRADWGKKTDYEQCVGETANFCETLYFTIKSNKAQNKIYYSDEAPSNAVFKKPIFYDIMSNTKYADVSLISSDKITIPSHRIVLAKYSVIFEKIFENSKEIPVKVQMEKFDAETINAALEFLYGKSDVVTGKAKTLLEFATAFAITELKEACSFYCNEQLNASNVCEIIQIAYANNLEELKKKCKKLITEKKSEIDRTKFLALPNEILLDALL